MEVEAVEDVVGDADFEIDEKERGDIETELPESVVEVLRSLESSIGGLEEYLEPLFSVSLQDVVAHPSTSDVDACKLYAALAYSLHTLFFGILCLCVCLCVRVSFLHSIIIFLHFFFVQCI
jgi:hypothetical protein